MSDLDQTKADILITKGDLAQAKRDGNGALILMYGNLLASQQNDKVSIQNLLLAQGKNSLFFPMLSLPTDKIILLFHFTGGGNNSGGAGK